VLNGNGIPDIERLFDATSIALVGASERSHFARNLMGNLRDSGFDGQVHLVHPKQERQFDSICVPSLAEIDGEVDVAYVLTGAETFPEILADCGSKRIPWAVVLSGGFKETGDGGAAREAGLAEIAHRHGVTILGPNSLGFLSSRNRLAAYGSVIATPLLDSGIGLVSHSGAMSVHTHRHALRRGIGISAMVAAGNCAMVNACDLLSYFVEDPRTRVVAAILESLDPTDAFVEVAQRAVERGKPLIVLKIGRTRQAHRAAVAHTGALAGDDRVVDGVLRQLGVLRVDEPEQLVELAGLLAVKGWPPGPRTAFVTGSGGGCGIVADLIPGTRIELASYSTETEEALRELIGETGVPQNPLDLTGFLSRPDAWAAGAAIVAGDPGIDAVVSMLDPPGERSVASDRRLEASLGVDASLASAGKYGFFCGHVGGDLYGLGLDAVAQHGLYYGNGIGLSLYALDKAIEYSAGLDRLRAARLAGTRQEGAGLALPSGPRTLTERECEPLLKLAGIGVPRSELAVSAAEAGEIAERLGYPVVLKIQSRDVPHKTDVGGVLTGVTDRAQAQQAFSRIVANVAQALPEAEIDGVLVAEQVSPIAELLLGVSTDSQFGAVVTLGAGGVFTELLDDVAVRRPPLTRADVEDMLAQLRVARLLDGYRGAPAGDRQALVDAVVAIGDLALEVSDRITELELNPLLVLREGEGVVAADALVVIR
jgi:acetate---CoA ligase (ADP-forming)